MLELATVSSVFSVTLTNTRVNDHHSCYATRHSALVRCPDRCCCLCLRSWASSPHARAPPPYLSRSIIGAMDMKWHLECFICCECSTPFCDGTPFVEHDGKAYCPADHGRLFGTKCEGCGKVLSGAYLEQVQRFEPDPALVMEPAAATHAPPPPAALVAACAGASPASSGTASASRAPRAACPWPGSHSARRRLGGGSAACRASKRPGRRRREGGGKREEG